MEYVRKLSSGLRNIGRKWEAILLPAHEDPCDLKKNKGDQMMGMIGCVIRCTIGWCEMLQDGCKLRSTYPGVCQIYTTCRTVHLRYPSISIHCRRAAHLHHPSLSVHPLLLSSTKLSCGGGEKWIFQQQWSISVILEEVASVATSDRRTRNSTCMSAVMFATPPLSSFAAVFIWASFLVNVFLGPVAIVPTSCNCYYSWCWDDLSKSLHKRGVAR